MPKLLNTFAPPFSLVGAYFFVAIILAMISIFVYFGADFGALMSLKTASFFHLFLVGFVMSIIIGSLYQLSSVILDKPFYSLKGSYTNLVFYIIDLIVFVAGLYSQNMVLIGFGGVMLFLNLTYFGLVYMLTFLNVKELSFAGICLFVSSVMLIIGLCLGLLLVLILVLNLNFDFVRILDFHLYFVFGFIFFVVLGASSVLLPMFSLAHNVSFGFYYSSFGLYLLAGLLLLFRSQDTIMAIIFAALMLVAQCVMILRNRVRKAYDYWSINLIISFISLVCSAIMYKFGSINSAIILLFYGALYPFITAHIYKIMPFLIWYHYVAKFVGKTKVPMLEDMVIKKFTYIAILFDLCGIAIELVVSKFGTFFIAVSIFFVILNMLNFIRYTKFGV
ncbi:putative membrane protein [Campylobacter iguaniorum]|uniref:hypothetical protein n=1 Tax=Campylobacter iguaniorum TaxID=1244531 RepID=UPI00073A15D9|nr:hypothetical protein [Campylobacter iguaniorum]ALV24206.1 putative membrane protein [Campylobacter iguaniorum]